MDASWWRAEKKTKQILKTDDSFDEMDLKDSLLRGIYSYGFEIPSSIQSETIRPISERRDVLAQSQSGTGKTAAFVIGILNQIDFTNHHCQALILAPARYYILGE